MWLLDKMLTKLIRAGKLVITDYDGKVYEYGPGGPVPDGQGGTYDQPIRIRLTDKKASGHIARYPQVGAGEAFMWGWLHVEEPYDIRDMILYVTGQAKVHGDRALQPQGPMKRLIQKTAAKVDSINLKSKARKNAEHTYNLTRRLYELFLDEDRQYTMGYHRTTDVSLEKAQLDKKALIAGKMYMQKAREMDRPMRVLDIGCGWGGLAHYLNKHYGCEVLGVALAPDQIAFCKERAKQAGVDDKVKFKLMDYRDVEGTFDRISSVGLLEHVGTPHYPQFMEHTHRLLADDGVMFSHCCGRAGPPGFTDAWTRKYIFPGGYIPALSELVTESEKAGWQVMDVEAMRFHYSHTLEEWYNRTVLHREEITEMYDEQFYKMWLFYLAGAEQSFRHGTLVNWQLQYVKDRNAVPMIRDYMEEEATRLRNSEEPPAWHLDPALKQAAE
ncbi:cyclopropane-fatty-acyl-phospholipid synthase family protein [Aurantiacibacter flavus]